MLLKMKLEQKEKGGAVVAQDDTGKGGNWWQHRISSAGVRIAQINKQKATGMSGA